MIKIIEIAKLGSISVLFLDSDLPRAGWNKVMIDGIKYAPVPIYDMEKVVAVVGDGFYCGQEVEFLHEVGSNMWNGIWTRELDTLYDEYMEKFDGALPDGYDEFIQYMKICIETGLEMPDIVPGIKRQILMAHFYTVFHRMCVLRDNDRAQTIEVWALLRHYVPSENLQFLRLRLSLQDGE